MFDHVGGVDGINGIAGEGQAATHVQPHVSLLHRVGVDVDEAGEIFGTASQVKVEAVSVDAIARHAAAFSSSSSATLPWRSEGNKNPYSVDEAHSTSVRKITTSRSVSDGINCSKKIRRQIQQLIHMFVPGKGARPLLSALRKLLRQFRRIAIWQTLRGQFVRRKARKVDCGILADFAMHRRIGGNNRQPAGHGLDQRMRK